MTRLYYKDVKGVLLVFDITRYDSFEQMKFWLADLNKYAPEKITKILVGNKLDLTC